MALISVIVPCYNTEKYVNRLMESLEMQTIGLANIEIICVDDASTDNTLDVLKLWEQKYSDNIMIVACEKNGRQGTARNIGLEYASSEYIAFIDGDDWIEPDYLEYMYNKIIDYNLQVVTCGIKRDSSEELSFFEQCDNALELSKQELIIVENDMVRKKVIMHQPFGGACCKLIKKEFLISNNIYYPEGLAYEDLYWREIFHLHVTRGVVLEKPMYHYYVNPESTTLAMNQSYHYDYFTIAARIWNYWEMGGYLSSYRDELEYEYMIIAGLQILKVLVLRFDKSQYSLFQLLQTLIKLRIPNIRNNPYLNRKYFTESQLLIIELFYKNLTEKEFESYCDMVKKIGI